MVLWNGSTLLQPRGSGPSSVFTRPVVTWLYLVAVEQVLTTPRPVLEPTDATKPDRSRALNVMSKPSQWLSRSEPNADSDVRNVFAGIAAAAAVGVYTVIGYPPPPGRRESSGAVSV